MGIILRIKSIEKEIHKSLLKSFVKYVTYLQGFLSE